jgi:hypothetical protein
VRAKVQVQSVTLNGYAEVVKYSAVSGGSKEDNSFSAATPSGSIELHISNKELWGTIKPGQKFYVDFTPAD